MRRSTRKSSMGIGLGVEERPNSNPAKKLTDDQRNAIKKVGFGNLLLIPNQMLSKNLLVELMERWNSEEGGFMLPPGMIKITLMDVALILGIRMIGYPIHLREDEAFSDLESDYGAALWKRKITVASLESRLDSLGEVVNEDFVRTFILFTFGTLLFPTTNGKVDSRYLSFLKNLDDIGHFAWGAAVLEDLFMWLNKRKESNVQYIGGCLILLQIWSYEHIDLARPDLINSYLMVPRACRWENSRPHQRQWFAAKFRELQDHQITWQLQPTSEELEFDVINELLEVESSSIDNSSDGASVISVVGLQKELDVHNSSKVQVKQGKDVSLKQSRVSQCIPEVQTRGFPSTSCTLILHKGPVELSSQCQNSEKLTRSRVVGLQSESDTNVTSTSKIQAQKGEEVYLKQSTASRHLPEVQTEVIEFPSTSCASELQKEFVELYLSSQCENSLKLTSVSVDELHLESDVTNTSKVQVQKVQEVYMKQSTASQHIPEVQTGAMASCVPELHKECRELSSQCHNSEKSMSGNEDELIKRNQILEVQNMELRKEVEALKVENRQLKMHLCSTNDLVTRLEGLVMDETYSS